MIAKSLQADEASLLSEILGKRSPKLLARVETLGIVSLSPSELDAFRDILTDELCETGLRPDSEPNARGLMIEHLIDKLRRFSSDAQAQTSGDNEPQV